MAVDKMNSETLDKQPILSTKEKLEKLYPQEEMPAHRLEDMRTQLMAEFEKQQQLKKEGQDGLGQHKGALTGWYEQRHIAQEQSHLTSVEPRSTEHPNLGVGDNFFDNGDVGDNAAKDDVPTARDEDDFER